MRCLNAGRVIWAAYSVGAAEHLLELVAEHLTARRQFGRPLADNQGLQWQLADMAADLHAARLVAHDAAVRYDREPDRRPEIGAMAKLIAGEMAFRVADRAMQLFGGAGYSKALPDRAHLARRPRDPHPRRHVGDPADDRRPPRARLRAGLTSPGVE